MLPTLVIAGSKGVAPKIRLNEKDAGGLLGEAKAGSETERT